MLGQRNPDPEHKLEALCIALKPLTLLMVRIHLDRGRIRPGKRRRKRIRHWVRDCIQLDRLSRRPEGPGELWPGRSEGWMLRCSQRK